MTVYRDACIETRYWKFCLEKYHKQSIRVLLEYPSNSWTFEHESDINLTIFPVRITTSSVGSDETFTWLETDKLLINSLQTWNYFRKKKEFADDFGQFTYY